jgi:serine/threonine protein kinase
MNCEIAFPGVPIFLPSEVVRLAEIEDEIFKVKLHQSILCLKTVHRTGNKENFIREVSNLRQCYHPNIIRLVGLVQSPDNDGKVEGMVVDYVENARTLRNIETISACQFEKWERQIREAIEYLHSKDLVWGDAKPANILIGENDRAVLIDFGGGTTKGWVDHENSNTSLGDLQGLQRIISFMKSRMLVLE